MAAIDAGRVAWWREPTKDQWYAWWAAWLGWTLDAFDFTVFLLIIKPIADEFHVPTTEVAIVFTLTLWMRLVGAVASGWLADRVGRKLPLMISIFWYWIRYYVKEPEVWVENRRIQREQNREVRAPLVKIFQRGMLANTLMACWWMASNFVLYYSIWALFATHLQQDLKLTSMGTALQFM